MSAALFWSGGKDSLLALDRAERSGLQITHLVNISTTTRQGKVPRKRHHEPLWGCEPIQLVHEFIERGHRSKITSVYLRTDSFVAPQGTNSDFFSSLRSGEV